MTIIYDTQNNELPVGVFDTQDSAAKFLGITYQSLKVAIWRDTLIFKRYKVVYYKNKSLGEISG